MTRLGPPVPAFPSRGFGGRPSPGAREGTTRPPRRAADLARQIVLEVIVVAAAIGIVLLGRTAVHAGAGPWFLAGVPCGIALAVAAAVAVDRRRYRQLRDLNDYLGADLESRKVADMRQLHEIRVMRWEIPT
jgi:hypothetical protein